LDEAFVKAAMARAARLRMLHFAKHATGLGTSFRWSVRNRSAHKARCGVLMNACLTGAESSWPTGRVLHVFVAPLDLLAAGALAEKNCYIASRVWKRSRPSVNLSNEFAAF
jgi:hypothetical protein